MAQIKNLPLTEVYKTMTLAQLEMILHLKKMRPKSAENAGRIAEVVMAMQYVKTHGTATETT